MKKTLIALAAFAATAAFAQSSVTLYGIADAYVGQVKGFGAGTTQTVVNSGGLSESRIGLSVKEDLGAGLQAFAVFENAYSVDDGTGATGNRKSVLGLTGSFGTVSLGNQESPFRNVVENVLDAQSVSAFSAVLGMVDAPNGVVIGSNLPIGTQRIANSVRYDTPNFDGFSAAVQVGLGENKTAALRAARDTSFNVQYANGPLGLALAHEINETLAGVNTRVTATALAGTYDFGVAKLNLGFINGKEKGTTGNDKGINIGVTAPIGAFTVVGQLSRNKATDGLAAATGGTGNRTSLGLEGHYALSKRTTSYVGFNQTKNNNIVAPNSNKSRILGVGVRHVF